jgi:hypothetical protein
MRLLPECIPADGTDERGRCTEAGGCDGLIPALPAMVLRKGAASDGLAVGRETLPHDHEIDVDRADDDDTGGHRIRR